jgi:hypothetical protein
LDKERRHALPIEEHLMSEELIPYNELPRKRKYVSKAYEKEATCDALIDHMASGLSFKSFGAVCGVSLAVLSKWLQEFEEFYEAKEIGELALLKHHEEQLNRVGKNKETGDASIAKYQLQSRFPEDWTPTQKISSTNFHDVKLDMSTLSDDELTQILAIGEKIGAIPSGTIGSSEESERRPDEVA